MKKFLSKLGWALGGIAVACFCLFSVFVGVDSVVKAVVAVVTIAGHGSLIRGIILAPFFVFGCFQIIRGFIKVLESADPYYYSEKRGKRYDLSSLYFLAMVIGYLTVLSAFPAFGTPSEDSETTYEAGYSAGLEEGREEGFNDGHFEGYEEGFDQGRSEGYDDGYDEGYSEGYDLGYDNGYDDCWYDK